MLGYWHGSASPTGLGMVGHKHTGETRRQGNSTAHRCNVMAAGPAWDAPAACGGAGWPAGQLRGALPSGWPASPAELAGRSDADGDVIRDLQAAEAALADDNRRPVRANGALNAKKNRIRTVPASERKSTGRGGQAACGTRAAINRRPPEHRPVGGGRHGGMPGRKATRSQDHRDIYPGGQGGPCHNGERRVCRAPPLVPHVQKAVHGRGGRRGQTRARLGQPFGGGHHPEHERSLSHGKTAEFCAGRAGKVGRLALVVVYRNKMSAARGYSPNMRPHGGHTA